MNFTEIYKKFNENNLDKITNKVSNGNGLNNLALNIRNGKRTHQVSVNADRDIDEDFDYNRETGVYTSKEENKFGAKDSFAEAIEKVYNSFVKES